jgi:rhodanese-related sulfurtransferase
MENIYWIIAIVAIGVVFSRRSALSKDIKNITSEEAYKLMGDNKELLIIDVRTKQEYKSGHIPGAKSIPAHELQERIAELQAYKDKPILIHCASGGRSPGAARFLLKYGFKDIYHLNRGLIGWRYELIKKQK